jgi:hypothetical protein
MSCNNRVTYLQAAAPTATALHLVSMLLYSCNQLYPNVSHFSKLGKTHPMQKSFMDLAAELVT